MSEWTTGIQDEARELSGVFDTEIVRIGMKRKYGHIETVIGSPENWGLACNSSIQVVAPTLQLAGFRASAHFDTVKILLEVSGTPPVRTAWKVLQENGVITSVPERWKSYFGLGFRREFLCLTIHNPTLEKLAAIYSAFDQFGGLLSEPIVYEAHFALDWKHKSYERVVSLASVLPQFVKAEGVSLKGAGTPRQFIPNGKFHEKTGRELGDTLHLRTSIKTVEVGEARYAHRPLVYQYNAAYDGPFTTYFGSRRSDHIRVYLKDQDDKKPIPKDRQVVRHERDFRRKALVELGITTLASLLSFDFGRLAKSFSYEVAYFDVSKAIQGKVERLRKLVRSGVFAVRESEGGVRYRRCRPVKVTLAHAPMNKRSNSAFRSLADKWG